MAAKKPEKPSAKKTTGAAKAGAAKAGAAKAGAAKAGAAKGAGKGTAAAPKKGSPTLKKVVAAARKAVSKPAAAKTVSKPAAKPVVKTAAKPVVKTAAKPAAPAKPAASGKKAAPSAAKAKTVVKKAAPAVAERAAPEPRRQMAPPPATTAPRRLRPTKPTKEMYSAATGTNTSDPFPAKELEKFRQLIHDIRAESIEELDMLTEQLREMTAREVGEDNNAYSLHMAEQGTDAMEREKTFLQAQRTSDYVKKLGEALERITNKSFGICRICGLRLDSKRLLAVPVTQVCTVYKNTSKPCEPGRLHMLETGVNEEDVPG